MKNLVGYLLYILGLICAGIAFAASACNNQRVLWMMIVSAIVISIIWRNILYSKDKSQ